VSTVTQRPSHYQDFDDILPWVLLKMLLYVSDSFVVCAIQMSFEARSAAASGEVLLALQSQSRVESMLPAMKSIAGIEVLNQSTIFFVNSQPK